MTAARVCEWDGCEVEVTGRAKRCPAHQAEHRRKTDSARKRQARNADKCGQPASAVAPVPGPEPEREAKARPEPSASAVAKAAKKRAGKDEAELRRDAVAVLMRAGLPKDLIERTRTKRGAPFDHREAFANLADGDHLTLREAFKRFAGFSNREFDRLTGTGGGENERPTQANQLIDIANTGCKLFHDGEDAFAEIEIENDGHLETWLSDRAASASGFSFDITESTAAPRTMRRCNRPKA